MTVKIITAGSGKELREQLATEAQSGFTPFTAPILLPAGPLTNYDLSQPVINDAGDFEVITAASATDLRAQLTAKIADGYKPSGAPILVPAGMLVNFDLQVVLGDKTAETPAVAAASVSYDNTQSALTATNTQAAIDELAARQDSPVDAIIYLDGMHGVDKEGAGGLLDPVKTLQFAEEQLPAEGGVIRVLGSITDNYTQSKDNVLIEGYATQWSPSSFITGNITQPAGRQRIKLSDIQIDGAITIQGNGNNYFKNVNKGTFTLGASSTGFNEFFQCEADAINVTQHTGNVLINECRNLQGQQASATAVVIIEECDTITGFSVNAGAVFTSDSKEATFTHAGGLLDIVSCSGLSIDCKADTTAGNKLRILSSDFYDRTSNTDPIGYKTFTKTGACPLITNKSTAWPNGTVPAGAVILDKDAYLTIGTTATTAMAGNKVPTATERGGVMLGTSFSLLADTATLGNVISFLNAVVAELGTIGAFAVPVPPAE